MTPQPVVIYGVPCTLRAINGGGSVGKYAVTAPGGQVLTQQPSRLLAVAKAAEVLRRPT